MLSRPQHMHGGSSGNFLNLQTYQYDITRWDNSTLLFQTATPCIEYVYTIDRANKRAVGTRTTKANPTEDCSLVENRRLSLTLSDGFEVWSKVNQEVERKIVPFMWASVAVWWIIVALFAWRRGGGPLSLRTLTIIIADEHGMELGCHLMKRERPQHHLPAVAFSRLQICSVPWRN